MQKHLPIMKFLPSETQPRVRKRRDTIIWWTNTSRTPTTSSFSFPLDTTHSFFSSSETTAKFLTGEAINTPADSRIKTIMSNKDRNSDLPTTSTQPTTSKQESEEFSTHQRRINIKFSTPTSQKTSKSKMGRHKIENPEAISENNQNHRTNFTQKWAAESETKNPQFYKNMPINFTTHEQ